MHWPVLENRGSTANWIQIALQGSASNRDGLGATVTVEVGDESQSWLVRTGSSYLSQSQVDPTFGLAAAESISRVLVNWPSGATSELTDVAVNQRLTISEDGSP